MTTSYTLTLCAFAITHVQSTTVAELREVTSISVLET